jgi:hypothetical protein
MDDDTTIERFLKEENRREADRLMGEALLEQITPDPEEESEFNALLERAFEMKFGPPKEEQ